jgi:hypothetical protein
MSYLLDTLAGLARALNLFRQVVKLRNASQMRPPVPIEPWREMA